MPSLIKTSPNHLNHDHQNIIKGQKYNHDYSENEISIAESRMHICRLSLWKKDDVEIDDGCEIDEND